MTELCRKFLRGDCHRGASCRFSHVNNRSGSDTSIGKRYTESRERKEWGTSCRHQTPRPKLNAANEKAKAELLERHIGGGMGDGLYRVDQLVQNGVGEPKLEPMFNGDLDQESRKAMKLKEVYLALGRRCVLVYSSPRGQRILRRPGTFGSFQQVF